MKKPTKQYQLAIHEAGHAVVAHLVGVAIDHVTIIPEGRTIGHSMPVRDRDSTTADKLWKEATAIRRTLVWGRLTDGFDGKEGWLLRKGSRRRYWKFDRTFKPRPSRDNCGTVTTHGTPARELGKRMEGLRKRAMMMWTKIAITRPKREYVKDLMHTLGGPVADFVFFNMPFEAPRVRTLQRIPGSCSYGYTQQVIGNHGARTDFRMMREALKHIDNANWKEAREFYRGKAERLVRRHGDTIERVAKALLRRKTLSGAELEKLIKQSGRA